MITLLLLLPGIPVVKNDSVISSVGSDWVFGLGQDKSDLLEIGRYV